MKIEFENDTRHLRINGRSILLSHPIWQVKEYKDRVIVILHPDSGMDNVLCYDENGTLIWTIEKPAFFKVEGTGYEAVRVENQGKDNERLFIVCRGRPFYLDIQTGKVEFIPGNFER